MVTLHIGSPIAITDRYKLGYTDSSCHPACNPYAHCCHRDSYCDCYPSSANADCNPNACPMPGTGPQRQ